MARRSTRKNIITGNTVTFRVKIYTVIERYIQYMQFDSHTDGTLMY